MRHSRIFVVCLVLVIVSAFQLQRSRAQSLSDGIIYLNLKMVNGRVGLAEVRIVQGRLKIPKKMDLQSNCISYVARNDAGVQLAHGVADDPSEMRMEYVTPSGQLQTKVIKQDSTHFFIRLPFDPQISRIDFERIKDRPGLEWLLGKRHIDAGSIRLTPEDLRLHE